MFTFLINILCYTTNDTNYVFRIKTGFSMRILLQNIIKLHTAIKWGEIYRIPYFHYKTFDVTPLQFDTYSNEIKNCKRTSFSYCRTWVVQIFTVIRFMNIHHIINNYLSSRSGFECNFNDVVVCINWSPFFGTFFQLALCR